MVTDERREDEWQAMIRATGTAGVVWAVVRLLIAKGVFTSAEIFDALGAEAGRQSLWKARR